MDVGAPEVGLVALPPSHAGEAWSGLPAAIPSKYAALYPPS